jgi:hypothetical protein
MTTAPFACDPRFGTVTCGDDRRIVEEALNGAARMLDAYADGSRHLDIGHPRMPGLSAPSNASRIRMADGTELRHGVISSDHLGFTLHRIALVPPEGEEFAIRLHATANDGRLPGPNPKTPVPAARNLINLIGSAIACALAPSQPYDDEQYKQAAKGAGLTMMDAVRNVRIKQIVEARGASPLAAEWIKIGFGTMESRETQPGAAPIGMLPLTKVAVARHGRDAGLDGKQPGLNVTVTALRVQASLKDIDAVEEMRCRSMLLTAGEAQP